jgi:hypothetical protein
LLLQPLSDVAIDTADTGDNSEEAAGTAIANSPDCCSGPKLEEIDIWPCDVRFPTDEQRLGTAGMTESAATASPTSRASEMSNRRCGSFSNNPKIAVLTSSAVLAGNSSGGFSQIRRTNAKGLPASNGRFKAASSKRQTPKAQASAAGP